MAKLTDVLIGVGLTANDKTGDSLRAAFQKVNVGFTDLYTKLGLVDGSGLNLGAFTFTGSTMSTDDSTPIVIDQATTITSNLTVGGDVLPSVALGGDLGSSARPWKSLYVSGSTIYLGNAALRVDANGELLINNNRILQDNGNYISLNSNVNDVQVSDLQVGDTLQWAGGFWVNGPGGGSTLVNGANTVSLDSDGVLTLPNGSTIGSNNGFSGVPITTDRGTILLGNSPEIGQADHFHIMKGGQQALDLFLGDDSNYVKLPDAGGVEIATQNFNQYSWTFGTDGHLTIPGDIRSEGNINIDINLSDSTLRRWSFGEDGDLTLAGNIESADVLDITAQSQIRLVSRDDNVQIRTNATSEDTYIWQFGSDGELTLPGGRTRIGTTADSDAIIANEDEVFGVIAQGTNGAVQLVWIEDLENAYTSNLAAVYVNSGNLGSVRIATGANGGPGPNYWEFNNSGALTFPQGTTFATTDGTGAFIIDGAADKDVQIYTYSGDNARGWTFGTDGSLQIPGDIKSNGNINIDINLSDSTLRRWQFGEDGILTVPGPISGLGNAKLDFTTYANVAYLTTTSDDTTALYMGSVSAELYAQTNILIRTNTDGTAKVWTFGDDGSLTLPGNILDSTGVNQTAQRVEGSWTVTAGTNTYSFTLPSDGTYTMWVKGNIPNGIIVWNATASVSNTNVPAIGTQYAWNYTGGGTPISLTSIPDQIKGVAGTISTDATYAGTTSNRFDFGISNTSGASQTVYYGYTKI
jgi:hypothetical protein